MGKFFLNILIIILFASCHYKKGSGNIISEKRNVSSFHGINVSQGVEVELKIAAEKSVTIEADDNFIEDIKTRVSDGVLNISVDEDDINNAHLKAFITCPAVDVLKASSAAIIHSNSTLNNAAETTLETSSGSSISVIINSPSVQIKTSSGSKITVKGRSRDLNAKASSGSSVNAAELFTENAITTASSGSTINIYASVSINASASSGASIHYKGGATVTKSISSGGEVSKF